MLKQQIAKRALKNFQSLTAQMVPEFQRELVGRMFLRVVEDLLDEKERDIAWGERHPLRPKIRDDGSRRLRPRLDPGRRTTIARWFARGANLR